IGIGQQCNSFGHGFCSHVIKQGHGLSHPVIGGAELSSLSAAETCTAILSSNKHTQFYLLVGLFQAALCVFRYLCSPDSNHGRKIRKVCPVGGLTRHAYL
ncbi:MAG: hypothetical protein ACUVR3_00600, partial [Candidatus Roseilinea sp.]|uniref:hypothetical protein n=1 Tax=Candidatus Roseilinea sp. TaxID=2838777 RepID=UPI004049E108